MENKCKLPGKLFPVKFIYVIWASILKRAKNPFCWQSKKPQCIMNGAFDRFQGNAILEIVLLLSHQD